MKHCFYGTDSQTHQYLGPLQSLIRLDIYRSLVSQLNANVYLSGMQNVSRYRFSTVLSVETLQVVVEGEEDWRRLESCRLKELNE